LAPTAAQAARLLAAALGGLVPSASVALSLV